MTQQAIEFYEAGRTQLNNQMADIPLTDAHKTKIIDYLVERGTVSAFKLADLGDFFHGKQQEGKAKVVRTLLVNEQMVYVFEETKVLKDHAGAYNAYLAENELHADEYNYESYLADNSLEDTTTTEVENYVGSTPLGQLYLQYVHAKASAEKHIQQSADVLEKIVPLIADNFIPVVFNK